MHVAARRRPQGGFSFIEILVVMGIITLLTSMVVVVIPIIREKGNQTKSAANIKNLITAFNAISPNINQWPPYNGKNFTLAPIAHSVLNPDSPGVIDGFFSPGDAFLKRERVDIERYRALTVGGKAKLKSGEDNSELTSYAGRMNGGGEDFVLTSADISKNGTICLCDDDKGPLHHPSGLMIGFAGGLVELIEWEDMAMTPPKDARKPDPFLGENASTDLLRAMSSN